MQEAKGVVLSMDIICIYGTLAEAGNVFVTRDVEIEIVKI
jgi:hypothetical protein